LASDLHIGQIGTGPVPGYAAFGGRPGPVAQVSFPVRLPSPRRKPRRPEPQLQSLVAVLSV